MRLVLAISTLLPALILSTSIAGAEVDPELSSRDGNVCAAADGHAARFVGDVTLEQVSAVRGFDFAELVLEPSAVPFVVIEGAPAAIVNIDVTNVGGALTFSRSGCVASHTPIRITVGSPSFEEISAGPASAVRTRGAIAATDATIELENALASRIEIAATGEVVLFASGSSRHELSVRADSVVAMHTGTGDITLSGKVRAASLSQRGLGAVFARSLEAIEEIVVESDGGTIFARR